MERKFIKRYIQFVNESNEAKREIIIHKGEELFHGTVEDFDIKDIRPGGYDEILWTAKEPAIAQTYIPVSGLTTNTSTKYFQKPIREEASRNMQVQMGIVYDYDSVEFDFKGDATSYKTPPIWEKDRDEAYAWRTDFFNTKRALDSKKEEFIDSDKKFGSISKHSTEDIAKYREYRNSIKSEISSMQEKYDEMEKKWFDYANSDKKELAYINEKLKELGYEPTYESSDNNFSWKLKMKKTDDGYVILPSDYREVGRLLIIKPKEDLRIFDLTEGGRVSGDLMDLDYHKLDLFRKVEEEGYDGIKINDFAQIESEGNFGHHSIGLFESTIPKLDIVSIPAVHPKDFGKHHYMKNDYNSDEYKEYKKSQ